MRTFLYTLLFCFLPMTLFCQSHSVDLWKGLKGSASIDYGSDKSTIHSNWGIGIGVKNTKTKSRIINEEFALYFRSFKFDTNNEGGGRITQFSSQSEGEIWRLGARIEPLKLNFLKKFAFQLGMKAEFTFREKSETKSRKWTPVEGELFETNSERLSNGGNIGASARIGYLIKLDEHHHVFPSVYVDYYLQNELTDLKSSRMPQIGFSLKYIRSKRHLMN